MRFLILLLFVGTLGTVQAQDDKIVDALNGVVDQFFEGLNSGDTMQFKGIVHPSAELRSVGWRPDGQVITPPMEASAFITAVGAPRQGTWEEILGERKYMVNKDMAVAWLPYEFRFDGQFSHCGVNVFTFVFTDEGWQVLAITDTRRSECP